MLIRFFKSNNPALQFLIPIYVIVFWVPVLFVKIDTSMLHTMSGFNLIYAIVGLDGIFSSLIAMLVVAWTAILLNRIIEEERVLPRNTNLIGLTYASYCLLYIDYLKFHPLIISNFFLVVAIGRVLKIYKQPKVYSLVFDASLLISLASFFYFPAIVFYPLVYVMLFLFRAPNGKDVAISLVGLLLPFFYLITYYIIIRNFENSYADQFFESLIFTHWGEHSAPWLGLSLVVIFTLLGWTFFTQRFGGTWSLRASRQLALFLWMILFGFFSAVFTDSDYYAFLYQQFIPFSILSALYFSGLESTFWKRFSEILFFLLLMVIVYNRVELFI